MIEYVYRPSRRKGKARVLSRLYCGRYSLSKGQPSVTVSLNTPDRKIAEKRLRDLIIEMQKEQEGMITPRSQRAAEALPLVSVVADYKSDLVGRELAATHVKETIGRIERMMAATGWKKLSDILPAPFVHFRAALRCSAKTKKEYQTSINAFLNWCVRTDRLFSNRLAKVDRVDIRGKSVRPTRAFTSQELIRLFSISAHGLFYQTLLYTGQRRTEVASLIWSDLQQLDGEFPAALFRDGTMKDKEKRAVPLQRDLAAALSKACPLAAHSDDLVFPTAATYEVLRGDMERAHIEHKDRLGRVVHFHAFRKTFQTMGVRAGINQRSAQALLGHSDPALTANAYTDVASLELHSEVAKLPWLTKPHAQLDAQKVRVVVRKRKIGEIVEELIDAAKSFVRQEDTNDFPLIELAARHGFEP